MIVDFVFSSCRIGCARAKRSLRSADASASKAPERRNRGVCFHLIFLDLERTLQRGHDIPGPPPHVHIHFSHSPRSEEHTSELQSLMRISYAVFCLQKKTNTPITTPPPHHTQHPHPH